MRTRTTLLASCSLGLLALSTGAVAQSFKLNLPLPRDPVGTGGDVEWFRIDPSGRWAVFVADAAADECRELFSAPLDGSAPARRLSAPLLPDGDVTSFAVDPGGTWVVYVADALEDERFELFSVPIDGGAPPRLLSGMLAPGADVRGALPAGDGLRVVFTADQTTDGVFDLWSVPLDGSAPPVQISAPGGNPQLVRLTPSGARLVYADEPPGAGSRELWSAPVDGSTAAVRLHVLPAFADARTFEITAHGARVVYLADALVDELLELWSVPIDASASPVRISGPLIAQGDVGGFTLSPDSSWVLYTADAAQNEVRELYRVPIAGGAAPQKLSGPLVAGGDVVDVRIDGDGSHVVFRADAAVDELYELWSVPADGSAAPMRLNDSLASGGGVDAFEIDAADARVLYRAHPTGAIPHELFIVPIDRSSPPIKLDPPAPEGSSGVESFQLSAGGRLVVYLGYTSAAQALELWSVPADGSRQALCVQSAHHLFGVDWSPYLVTQDGARVVYRADLTADATFELWSRSSDASAPAVRLNPPLIPDAIVGDIEDYLWVPDSRRVVYRGIQRYADGQSLHVVGLDPLSTPLWVGDDEWSPYDPPWKLQVASDGRWLAWAFWTTRSTPLDASEPAGSFWGVGPGRSDDLAISPSGTRIVFVWRGYPPFNPISRLYSATIDRRSSSIELCRADRIERFVIAPRGERMVYLERTSGRASLRSAGITGRIPPTTLHSPLGPERSIDLGYQISADGAWVVFVADLEHDDVFELYSKRLGGGLGPIRLSPPLGATGDVDGALRITPDGKRVVFVADALVDETFELFSVRIDGSAPPVRLSGAMVDGGDVARGIPATGAHGVVLPMPQFELSNDGLHVVYRADQDTDEVFELFSAPIDGSAPPARVHPSLAPKGDVVPLSTRIAPDGTVVYAADALADEELELFAAPLDGSAAPHRLNQPFVAGGDLWTDPALGALESLQVSADGAFAVYLADAQFDETFELCVAPLHGGQRARVLSGPLVAGGDVGGHGLGLGGPPPFRLSPDGRAVVYLADQDDDEVFELYASYLAPKHVRVDALFAK